MESLRPNATFDEISKDVNDMNNDWWIIKQKNCKCGNRPVYGIDNTVTCCFNCKTVGMKILYTYKGYKKL